MERMKRLGSALLAAVVAFSLALPAPALAWAAEGGLAAASIEAAQVDSQATTLDTGARVWDGSIDVSWFVGHEDDVSYTLTKPAQLAGLAAIVNGTADVAGVTTGSAGEQYGLKFTGKTVRLGADIVLNATPSAGVDTTGTQRNWVAIGAPFLKGTEASSDGGTMPHFSDYNYFDGTFDGAGHVVKNIYIFDTTEGTYGGVQALFANVGGHAVIQNVGIDGGFVYGRVAAGLVATSHATSTDYPHIIGCFNTANVRGNGSSTRGTAGIFAGEEQYRDVDDYHGAAVIANCYNTGTISLAASAGAPSGGIAGTGSVKMYGCYNLGEVESNSTYAGALAGILTGTGNLTSKPNADDTFEGASEVRDCYALVGTTLTDENGNAKLYNYVDRAHFKDGKNEYCPAVMSGDTADFKGASWFKTLDACRALSQSFEQGATAPQLYWQAGGSQIDFNRIDDYGSKFYEVWGIEKQAYTGQPLTPAVTVTFYEGTGSTGKDVYLHEGSDYTVAYANNQNTGTANVTVTGTGRFYGAQAVTFQIVDGTLDTSTIDEILAQWYYGTPVTPAVTVRASNGDKLKEGVDYTLSWSGNELAAGVDKATATVTVTATDDGKFAGEKTAEFTVLRASQKLEGKGTNESPYLIGSKADLQFLAYATSEQAGSIAYGDKCYELTGDVDATSSDATYKTDRPVDPLFSYTPTSLSVGSDGGFGGTFDGAGHAITLGLDEQGPSLDLSPALALMTYTKSGGTPTFKNLTLKGSVKCPHGAAAGFLTVAQSGTVTFENCVNEASIRGDAFYQGGASGFITQSSMSANLVLDSCVNKGAVYSSSSRAAGFVGALGAETARFENCSNMGDVASGQENGAGGIVCVILGRDTASADVKTDVKFKNCFNAGAVTVRSSGDAGGLVAACTDHIKSLSFERCYNVGAISYKGSGNNGAGLVGRSCNPVSFLNCYNIGDVTSSGSYANEPAGILGYASCANVQDDSGTIKMENVYSTGNLGKGSKPGGGIVGNLWLHTILDLDNVYFDTDSTTSAIYYDFGEQWPSAVSKPVVNGQAVGVDRAAMQSATFASMLGLAFSPDASDAAEWANGGFPVLKSGSPAADISAGSVASAHIGSNAAAFQYTGSAIKLDDLKVTDSNGDVLSEGKDYVTFYTTQTLADNSLKGRVIVQGVGQYSGSVEKTFDITPCPISDCKMSQVSSLNYLDYAGGEATQAISLTNKAGLPMREGTDYEVVYTQNTGIGTAYVLIEGKAPYYSGTLLRFFTIYPGDLSKVTLSGIEDHYPASNASGGLFVYETLTAPNGYVLQRTTQRDDVKDYARAFLDANGDQVMTANGYLATSLTEAGEYTIVLLGNAVEQGTNMKWTNGNWNGEVRKTFTYGNRLQEDAEVSGVSDTVAWTGSAITLAPQLVNKQTGYALDRGTDYTLSYQDASGNAVSEVKDAGDYKLVIAGKGLWYQTVEIPFTVALPEYFLGNAQVEGISGHYFYTGSAIKPVPTSVTLDDVALAGTDYAVSYEDANGNVVSSPTAKGTYYAVVSGLDPYLGSKRIEFSIEDPFMTVYTRTGTAGQKKVAKQFTKDEFVALKYANSEGEPVSALYCDEGGGNWKVASTNNYVRLDDLLGASGATWKSGYTVTYGGDGSKSASEYSYDSTRNLKFYPSTTATARDATDVEPAPFVFSISDASATIGLGYTTTAYDVEELNIYNAGGGNAPRAIMGVAPADYTGGKWANMRGQRLWSKTHEVIVTAPAANNVAVVGKAVTLDFSNSGAQVVSAANAFAVTNAKGSMSYRKTGGDAGLTVAGNGTVTVAKGLGAGKHTVTVAVTDAGSTGYLAATRTATFTVNIYAPNALSVKAKSPSVKYKKKAQTVKASAAYAVKGAQGKVTYSKAGGDAGIKVAANGNLTLKKGLKKGTHSVKVKVSAAGAGYYRAGSKTITVKVKVKK